MRALDRDLGFFTRGHRDLANTSVTAGASTDNVYYAGASIDLDGLGYRAEGITFYTPVTAVLGANQTCTLTSKIETSSDNSTWAVVNLTEEEVTLTLSSTAGGTVYGVAIQSASLQQCDRYVRHSVKPNLSRANTDTATLLSVAVLSGIDRNGV